MAAVLQFAVCLSLLLYEQVDQQSIRLLLIFKAYFLQTSMNVAMTSILVLDKRPVSITKENLSAFALKDMSEMERTTALVSAKFFLKLKLFHDLFYTYKCFRLFNSC